MSYSFSKLVETSESLPGSAFLFESDLSEAEREFDFISLLFYFIKLTSLIRNFGWFVYDWFFLYFSFRNKLTKFNYMR
jgi:hypothetical protein